MFFVDNFLFIYSCSTDSNETDKLLDAICSTITSFNVRLTILKTGQMKGHATEDLTRQAALIISTTTYKAILKIL